MRITRRAVLAGSAAAAIAPAIALEKRPNIVFITVDDLLSVVHNRERYGVRIETPNLNRLMADGVSFSNAFASTAVCNPSRTAIVSGMNPFRTGVHVNAIDWWSYVDPWETFPGILARQEWRVSVFGKVTHGSQDIWAESGVAEVAYRDGNDDADTVDRARAAIRRTGPWLVMAGLANPHAPFTSPPRFYEELPIEEIRPLDWHGDPMPDGIAENQREKYAELVAAGEIDDFIRDYLANVAEMDFHLGRLLEGIRALPEPPLVILTSDHGFSLGDSDAVTKHYPRDEACRAPLIFSGPGIESNVRHESAVSLLDIAPTVLELVGLEPPARFDGHSLRRFLVDPAHTWNRGALTTMGESVSLRTNRFRITRYESGAIELYDQVTDPESRNNLADEQPARRVEILEALDRRVAEWKTPKRRPGRPRG